MKHSSTARQRGLSLVELLVGMTIGLVIIGTLGELFANNSRARLEREKSAAQIENGRFATQLLLDDIRLAGYYGELNGRSIAVPPTTPDPCHFLAAGVPDLVTAMGLPVQGYDNAAAIPSCITDVKPGTDILVIRRASTCIPGAGGCDTQNLARYFYFQTALCAAQAGVYVVDNRAAQFTTLTKKDCATLADTRSYYTRIYFVANNDQPGDGVPTLKVAELQTAGFTTTPLVEGIEQLQLEYGLDTSGDGIPDAYTADPASYNGCAASDCAAANWRLVTVIKVHVLARNTQTTVGWADNRTYTLGKLADGVTDNVFGPYGDGYKRHVYTTVVRLNNVAGRFE